MLVIGNLRAVKLRVASYETFARQNLMNYEFLRGEW